MASGDTLRDAVQEVGNESGACVALGRWALASLRDLEAQSHFLTRGDTWQRRRYGHMHIP